MSLQEIWNKFHVTTRNFAFFKFSFPPSLTWCLYEQRVNFEQHRFTKCRCCAMLRGHAFVKTIHFWRWYFF